MRSSQTINTPLPGLVKGRTLAILVCLVGLIVWGSAYALTQSGDHLTPQPVILTDGQSRYPLGRYLEILEDPEKSWTIADVTSPEMARQFVPSQEAVPNFGFTDSAYWARLRVKNETSATQEWRLEQGLANTHYLDLYWPRADGLGYELKRSGVLVPFAERDFPNRTPVFRLSIPPDAEQTLYLRLESGASMLLDLTLWVETAFIQKNQLQLLGLGFYFGVMLIMLGYHLFLWFSLRDHNYLYYVWFLAGSLIYSVGFTGLGSQYLWPSMVDWQPFFVYMGVLLMMVAALSFTASFLDTRRQMPGWHRFIQLMMLGWIPILMAYPFFRYGLLVRLAQPLIVLTPLTAMGASLGAWFRGNRTVRAFLLGWMVATGSILVVVLLRMDLLPSNPITENSLQIGQIFFVFFWALALANRINLLKQAQAQAQASLVRQQEESLRQKDEFTLALRQANEGLEQRVTERTAELNRLNHGLQAEIIRREQAEKTLEKQNRALQVLHRVNLDIGAELKMPTLLPSIVEHAIKLLEADWGGVIFLYDSDRQLLRLIGGSGMGQDYFGPVLSLDEGMVGQVFQQAKPLIVNDYPHWEGRTAARTASPPDSVMGVPLLLDGQAIGVLGLFANSQQRDFSQEDIQLAELFAAQVTVALQNARLYEQAQTMAVDAERQRLARDLHDSVTQSLYSLTLLTSGWAAMARQGRLDAPQLVEHLNQLEEISLQGLKEMRLLLHQLRPPVLDELGLVGALQHRLDSVEQRVNITARLLTRGGVDELPPALEEPLFFMAQEALNNALRHAEATEVIVRIELEEGCLTLAVTDNGSGFDPAAPSFGLGLESIRERTEAIAGQVDITSTPQQGTTVTVTVALRPEERV